MPSPQIIISLLRDYGLWLIPCLAMATIPLAWRYSAQLAPAPKPDTALAPVPATLPPLSTLPTPSSLLPPVPLAANTNPPTKKTPPVSQAQAATHTVTPTSIPPLPSARPPAAQTAPAPQAVAPQPAYVPPPLEIRVGIARQVPQVVVSTSQQAVLQDRNGGALNTVHANQALTVQANGANLQIDGQSLPGVLWLTPAQGSYVAVGDRWYRGRVLLVSNGNSVIAVNYVDLEHYLTSVVGSEMHANAPAEALKAQAIAARSYALVHMIRPASDWFDLGDNQRWQVYKGLQSEYNTSQQAVLETAGQVLSHQGGVVESLYAATDAIVASVHQGRGMSQLGAYDLAKQGYNYQQILNRYYPGVGLARVILQQ
ncbi:hypothetical protein OLK001_04530 [Synechocystis sp. LKSZ1]